MIKAVTFHGKIMNVEKTELDGVLLITPPTIFKDFRGEYVETYNREIYHKHDNYTHFSRLIY